MPIELRTGLPGSGKTLGVVERLMEIRKTESHRPVKVLGITDLRDDLGEQITESQLRDWEQFPAGTIVVVDECQRYMPTRRAGDPPKWVSALSTHRHLGLDFILISQHPALIDPYVRRLVDRHVHTVRKYGTHWVERWSWPEVQSDPTSRMSQRAVEGKTRHRYSRLAMQAYTSSEMHTVKRSVPRFFFVGALLLVLVPLLSWAAVAILRHATSKQASALGAHGVDASSLPVYQPASSSAPAARPVEMTRDQWVSQRVPRVPGIPWSAPMWDALPVTTTPDLYCIIMRRPDGSDCGCITEQGTRAVVPPALCKQYATDGVYNPYRAVPDPVRSRDSAVSSRPVPSAASSSAGPVGVGDVGHAAGVPPSTYVPPTYGPWNPHAL